MDIGRSLREILFARARSSSRFYFAFISSITSFSILSAGSARFTLTHEPLLTCRCDIDRFYRLIFKINPRKYTFRRVRSRLLRNLFTAASEGLGEPRRWCTLLTAVSRMSPRVCAPEISGQTVRVVSSVSCAR